MLMVFYFRCKLTSVKLVIAISDGCIQIITVKLQYYSKEVLYYAEQPCIQSL